MISLHSLFSLCVLKLVDPIATCRLLRVYLAFLRVFSRFCRDLSVILTEPGNRRRDFRFAATVAHPLRLCRTAWLIVGG